MIILNINPHTAPRMTKSDIWKTDPNHRDPKKRQRECVRVYFAYRTELNWLCAQQHYELKPELSIDFIIKMPDTWSNKKKIEMNGKPHQQKPDCDNIIKSFMDSFGKDDSFVWAIRARKTWGYNGKILIY